MVDCWGSGFLISKPVGAYFWCVHTDQVAMIDMCGHGNWLFSDSGSIQLGSAEPVHQVMLNTGSQTWLLHSGCSWCHGLSGRSLIMDSLSCFAFRMNECLTTPQYEKQIGFWVSVFAFQPVLHTTGHRM